MPVFAKPLPMAPVQLDASSETEISFALIISTCAAITPWPNKDPTIPRCSGAGPVLLPIEKLFPDLVAVFTRIHSITTSGACRRVILVKGRLAEVNSRTDRFTCCRIRR